MLTIDRAHNKRCQPSLGRTTLKLVNRPRRYQAERESFLEHQSFVTLDIR